MIAAEKVIDHEARAFVWVAFEGADALLHEALDSPDSRRRDDASGRESR
jgi:hypothetical protein